MANKFVQQESKHQLSVSINILFSFFRLEQDIVRQGIFEAIKFCGSPKWSKFVISVAFDFHGFYHTCDKIILYVLYVLIYTWKLIFMIS